MSSLVRPTPRPAAMYPDLALSVEVGATRRVGLAATAHIQNAAFAAWVATLHADRLARTADAAYKTGLIGSDIYVDIVAAYGRVAVAEIQALALRGRC
jgi:hypothetical protein